MCTVTDLNVSDDHCRVKLIVDSAADPDSDYINANYMYKEVEGQLTNEVLFITAQSPLENTVTDFWSMIWHERTQYIVMLTDVYTYSEVCLFDIVYKLLR